VLPFHLPFIKDSKKNQQKYYTMEAIEKILEKYPGKGRDSLIPLLQEIQNTNGFLSQEAIVEVGKYLNLPSSKIFGVATFYNQFRFKPQGKYHIQVCRGTACHVLGSATVLETLQKELGVKSGDTTRDGLFSIEVVACIGACGLAPVIAINGEFHAKVNSDSIKEIIQNYKNREN
jgi:NADH-quinone oxidoreductase E subunit